MPIQRVPSVENLSTQRPFSPGGTRVGHAARLGLRSVNRVLEPLSDPAGPEQPPRRPVVGPFVRICGCSAL